MQKRLYFSIFYFLMDRTKNSYQKASNKIEQAINTKQNIDPRFSKNHLLSSNVSMATTTVSGDIRLNAAYEYPVNGVVSCDKTLPNIISCRKNEWSTSRSAQEKPLNFLSVVI